MSLNQLQEAKQKYEEQSKEQESLIDIFSEERQRRDAEEETLRRKLKVSLITLFDDKFCFRYCILS